MTRLVAGHYRIPEGASVPRVGVRLRGGVLSGGVRGWRGVYVGLVRG